MKFPFLALLCACLAFTTSHAVAQGKSKAKADEALHPAQELDKHARKEQMRREHEGAKEARQAGYDAHDDAGDHHEHDEDSDSDSDSENDSEDDSDSESDSEDDSDSDSDSDEKANGSQHKGNEKSRQMAERRDEGKRIKEEYRESNVDAANSDDDAATKPAKKPWWKFWGT